MQVKDAHCPSKGVLYHSASMWSVLWEVPHVKLNQTVKLNLVFFPLICANLAQESLLPHTSETSFWMKFVLFEEQK